ncbi:unnamed protein product [Paramecium sonneborni]|uniref:Uncharacterized protein n=1 Tax=Paramecium sonneborni TaxID=65129 RepID=A0A8S1RVE8_9CILI|nr:unnamed protein product [Paramecium sonneborni]
MIRKKKDGKLIASWKGEVIIKAGGYYKKGLKQELWNELFEDHFNQPQIFYTGEYSKDFKIGRWKYFSKIRLCFQFNNYLEMMEDRQVNRVRQSGQLDFPHHIHKGLQTHLKYLQINDTYCETAGQLC